MTPHPVLLDIESDEFLAEYGLLANPRALYATLDQSEQVIAIRRALASGEISEEAVRRFIARLLASLTANHLSPYDVSLAAIAVAVATRSSAFVEEFLLDLSRLDRCELPMAIRVARLAKERQGQVSGNKTLICSLVPDEQLPRDWEEATRFIEGEASDVSAHFGIGAA